MLREEIWKWLRVGESFFFSFLTLSRMYDINMKKKREKIKKRRNENKIRVQYVNVERRAKKLMRPKNKNNGKK